MNNTYTAAEKYARLEKINEIFTYFIIASGLIIIQLPLPFAIDKKVIYFLSVSVIIFSLVWHRVLPKKYSGLRKNFIESIVDISGVFLVTHFTGGVHSYFNFLYFLPILSTTIYMPLSQVITVTSLSSVLILTQAAFSFGQEAFVTNIIIATTQIWTLWIIYGYGKFLTGEITAAKSLEEDIKLEEIRQVDRLKDEFIFIVSHELRNPITAIRGYLEILITGGAGKIEARLKALLEKAFVASNKLAILVSLLLEVGRLDTGKIHFFIQKVSVKEILDRVLFNETIEVRNKNLEIKISLEKDLSVRFDAERLEEILSILVGNAIAFTPEFGTVEIKGKKLGEKVEIAVVDSGAGMSEEKRKRLFEEFYTEDAASEKSIKGTNVRMYVIREILKRMHGDVKAESKVGKGTTLTITLPSDQT